MYTTPQSRSLNEARDQAESGSLALVLQGHASYAYTSCNVGGCLRTAF